MMNTFPKTRDSEKRPSRLSVNLTMTDIQVQLYTFCQSSSNLCKVYAMNTQNVSTSAVLTVLVMRDLHCFYRWTFTLIL